MAVKYMLEYDDDSQNKWVVTIDMVGYAGSAISVRGVDREPCILEKESSDADDIFAPIINSRAIIMLLNQSNNIDVSELRNIKDKDARVLVTKNGGIEFEGYIIGGGIQEDMISEPSILALTATDGLSMLNDLDFTVSNTQPLPTPFIVKPRSPIQVIFEIITNNSNLGSSLPIVWNSSLKNVLFDDDSLSSSIAGYDGYIWRDGAGNRKSCGWLLENFMRSIKARIHQTGGRWVIDRIVDLCVDGPLEGRAISKTIPVDPLPVEIRESILSSSSNFTWIQEDAILMDKPAVSKSVITYDPLRFKNIVPNGGMNSVNTFSNMPYWWIKVGDTDDSMTVSSAPSIVGDNGSSVLLSLNAGINERKYIEYTMWNQLDINPNIVYGPHSITIDSTNLFKEMEFGFSYSITRAKTIITDGVEHIENVFEVDSGPLSFPLRFRVTFFNDNERWTLTEFGHWVKDGLTLAERRGISANETNELIQLGDIVSVNMNKRTILIPSITGPVASSQGLCVQILVAGNTDVYIDDVYIHVSGENEVYEAINMTSKSTNVVEDETQISSSPNGLFLSNYMTNWSTSNEEYLHADGTRQGSLTELASRAVVRVLGENRMLIDTSIKGGDYKFGDRWHIDGFSGTRFLETGSRYNTQTCITEVNLHEIDLSSVQIICVSYSYSGNTLTVPVSL